MAKILLVEDDNNLREIYEARLQAEGYEIVSAQDGEEALVVAKAEKPDLIISDVMMPKISGFEMLDILRNTEGLQHAKVIMLTALGQSEDQQRADKLGADRYLVKSQVTLEDIVKTAHDLLADESSGPVPTIPGASSEATPVAQVPVATPTPPPAPTTAPTIPVAAPPTSPDPIAPPPVPTTPTAATPPAQPAQPSASTIGDDKLMNDAVNALIADAEKGNDSPAEKPAEPSAITTEPKSSLTTSGSANVSTGTQDAALRVDESDKPSGEVNSAPHPPERPSADTGSDDDSGKGQVAIAHKKVIQPIEGGSQKSIQELLAIEEAKESGSPAPAPAAPREDNNGATAETAAQNALDAAKGTGAAQEEASVEAKIEDFVAGASSEPSQPTPLTVTPNPSSDTVPSPVPTPVQPISSPENPAPPAISQPPAAPSGSSSTTQLPPDPNTIAI